MVERPSMQFLPDGKRLHLRQGPIDLIIQADGEPAAMRDACMAAGRRFDGLLAELCDELALLRAPVTDTSRRPEGVVARRMHAAVLPFAGESFITPMAAVAGAVAEEILAAMIAAAPLRRAFVNNGGDIALHLAEGERFCIGLVDRPDRPSLFGTATIESTDPARGIATSGYPGRSFSRGIAEAVTVIAPTASMADAAATVICNAVDLPGHPAIIREPADTIQVETDLGSLPVTRHVGPLAPAEIDHAIERGLAQAGALRRRGLITTCAIQLQVRSKSLSDATFTKNTTRKFAHA